MTEDLLLGFAVGFAIGAWVFYRILKAVINRVVTDMETLVDHVEQSRIEVRLELDKDQFYMYNKATNEFMAQGRTLTELRQIVHTRWPNKSVVYSAEDDQEIFKKLKATANETGTSI